MGERRSVLIKSALVALLALAVTAGSSAAQGVNLGSYHALVIGNQAYRNLRSLQTPVADAQAVADLLKRDYGFANVRLLTNATRADRPVSRPARRVLVQLPVRLADGVPLLLLAGLPARPHRVSLREGGSLSF